MICKVSGWLLTMGTANAVNRVSRTTGVAHSAVAASHLYQLLQRFRVARAPTNS